MSQSFGALVCFLVCSATMVVLVACSSPRDAPLNGTIDSDGSETGGSEAKRLVDLPDRYLSHLKNVIASASESIDLGVSMVNDAVASSTEPDDGAAVSHLDHRHHHHHHHHFPNHDFFGGAQDFVQKFLDAINRSSELLASRLRSIEEKLSIVIECALNETSTVVN